MRTEPGIDAFESYGVPYIPPNTEAFIKMHKNGAELIEFYRKNSALLKVPYEISHLDKKIRRNWRPSDGYPKTKSVSELKNFPYINYSCRDNAIFIRLKELEIISDNSEKFDLFGFDEVIWFEGADITTEVIGYNYIKLSLYYIFLLNIYKPKIHLLHNVYDNSVRLDVFGNTIETSVIPAIEKIVLRSFGKTKSGYGFYGDCIARDIATIIRFDKSVGAKSAINNGVLFEEHCKKILISGGFDIQSTPSTGDYGADILAYKHDLSYAIQCKDTTKPAGLKAVQEAVAARSHYKVDFAVVCSSGGFTDAAIELATSNKVIICSIDQLVSMLS